MQKYLPTVRFVVDTKSEVFAHMTARWIIEAWILLKYKIHTLCLRYREKHGKVFELAVGVLLFSNM